MLTKRQLSILEIICCLAVISFAASSQSAAEQYPLILTWGTLAEVGLFADDYSNDNLPFGKKGHTCYYYGDGGYSIEISSSFLEGFTSRGFTRQSVCLGLVSVSKYDPETGRRLPTYIVVKPTELKAAYKHSKPELYNPTDNLSDEHPLDLPNCFRNGNPYTDCTFRFGRLTGKRLTAAQTDIYHQLGVYFDSLAPKYLTKTELYPGEVDLQSAGFCLFELQYCGGVAFENPLLRYSSATFWARSPSFPRGYGYALDADGGADQAVDPATVKAALQGLAKHKITAEELRRVLPEGR